MQSFRRFLCATFAFLMLGASIHARAAVFCVKTAAELTGYLGQAQSNNENNTIKIVAGTITPSTGFAYSMTNAFNLDIEGGWSDDCSTQRRDAGLTILDGTSTSAGAFYLLTYAGGNITLRYLTIKNYTDSYTLVMQALGIGNGDLRVENCLFLNNAPTGYAEVIAVTNETGGSGSLYFLDNAVIANTISGTGTAVYLQGGGALATCNLCVNNNTVSGNTLTGTTRGAVEVKVVNGLINANLANNIFWGNSGHFDLYIYNSAILVDNDVNNQGGTPPAAGSSGNITVDPLFVNAAANNYRLRAGSPARDTGDNSPPGTIRNYDLDGLARIEGALVDMGAYEYHDVIFADGFESP